MTRRKTVWTVDEEETQRAFEKRKGRKDCGKQENCLKIEKPGSEDVKPSKSRRLTS